MKVFIGGEYFGWSNPYFKFHNKEMSYDEIHKELIMPILKDLKQFFNWNIYTSEWKYLVYYAELDGVAYVYPDGWIMDQGEYDEYIANREGISNVRCWYRNRK